MAQWLEFTVNPLKFTVHTNQKKEEEEKEMANPFRPAVQYGKEIPRDGKEIPGITRSQREERQRNIKMEILAKKKFGAPRRNIWRNGQKRRRFPETSVELEKENKPHRLEVIKKDVKDNSLLQFMESKTPFSMFGLFKAKGWRNRYCNSSKRMNGKGIKKVNTTAVSGEKNDI